MNLLIKIPSVTYPERLKLVLNFLFDQLTGHQLAIETSEHLADAMELHWLDKNIILHLPLDTVWLNQSTSESLPSVWDFQASSPYIWHMFFFFLSNQQEFIYHQYDEHGRWIAPPPDRFWPRRDRPFLDIAAGEMIDLINQKANANICALTTNYQPVISIDVDQWYSYKSKSFTRLFVGWMRDARDARWQRIKDRWNVWTRKEKDPYDTLSWISQQAGSRNIKAEIFLSPTASSPFDKQFNISGEEAKNLIQNFDTIGVHPSYHVHEKNQLLAKEIEMISDWIDRPITMSRFHYLRGLWQERNQLLLAHDIRSDKTYSLIREVGFPNGTCHPFFYYDHTSEQSTDLLITPQIAMDVTLKDQLNLSGVEALEVLKPIIDDCKKYKGTASIIWHNSSFDSTEGWKEYSDVFPALLDIMQQ